MELEDTYQADVMRLHGVPEAAIAELYAVSKEHRIYGGSVTVDRTIRDGDVVEAGGRRLLVGERPGHSPTDTIFVIEDERLAIVGDHLIGHISSNPVIHRPLDRPASVRDRMPSLPLYIDSLQRTAALDVDLLLPGHGNPVEGHRALVQERLDFHDRRKERIFGGLAGGPQTASELAIDLWGTSRSGSRSSRSRRRSGISTCWRPRAGSSSSRATTGCCATRRPRIGAP